MHPDSDENEQAIYYQRLLSAYQEIRAILSATSGDERLRLLGQAGVLAQQLGKYQEAVAYLERAIESAQEQMRYRFEVANLIRLGIVFFEMKNYQAAEEVYKWALERISTRPETESYRDFALYHIGRLLIEQGLLHEAEQVFNAVLIMRQQKGDADLIASAREALQALKQMKQDNNEYGTH